ncbi:Concanavalin A-like lectin/glucanase [Cordyceps javanica]|uniref:chitinase n=1 Tax=Cordyceps javanica TaxID=43265 RepID=A0A545VZZ3_9HYPO|nr:Concanavalin A-like lectin/glucanase [Cordyceps javanica]TQW07293.1 Concanavalin A-like lectin/glucanase [Cordyceps javanica]
MMLSKTFVTAALALAASAQTSTKCSPLKQGTWQQQQQQQQQHRSRHFQRVYCPADPAVGKKGISCDFTKGACDAFDHVAGKAVTYGARGAVSAVDAPQQAPTLESKEAIFFGRLEVEMQAAPGRGVITSIVMLSDDLDEIDLEAVGSDNVQIQSNTFSRGDDSKHDLLGMLPVADLTGASHTYAVDWTTERIQFFVDGALKRTLRRADIPDRYPESPMRVKIGAWVAGYYGNAPGTIEWAGGVADFSNGPASSYFKRITVTDYAGGSAATDKDVKEYSYGDRTGSAASIKIHLADGSTTSAGSSPSSGSSSSSSSSSSSISSSTASSASSSSSSSSTAATETTRSSKTETTQTSTTESSTTTTTTSSLVTSSTQSSSNTTLTKTHSRNSTMVTKTTGGAHTSDGGASTITQTTTVSGPSSMPSTAAATGLTIGAGIAAVAAFLAL